MAASLRETLFCWSETKKIYGGKPLENIAQALARIITMDAALRIVYGVPTEAVEEFKAISRQPEPETC